MTNANGVISIRAIEVERGTTALGGFNFTALRLEIRRVLRNRRTLFFILVFPSIFFFIFGLSNKGARAAGGTVLGYIMISMAVYGAMVGNTSGGATVALERSLGWSRQLRLTPLHPLAYVTMKILTSMTLGAIAIIGTYAVGAVNGVHMPLATWIESGLAAWSCSFVFAAFGLFVGFLIPAENVMQYVGPLLAIMAMFGGLFIPLSQLPQGMQTFAKFTPMYGVGLLARAPLVGGATAWAAGSVIVWTLLFGVGAMALYRRDTSRV
ncbi:MAG TPA: ABC transporter permease [Gemmatimonadaceae bacterium]|jgi:ABC-2 type transport system permease protein|nr:ABC transporter permease [Gemmatimonadaceae bacterium]